MALPRTAIQGFSLKNNAYLLATVTFYVANADGTASATKATLYQDLTGVGTLANPQTLSSIGALLQAVYVDQDVVAVTTNAGAANATSGVLPYEGGNRGAWVTATKYFTKDIIIGPSGSGQDGNIYVSHSIWTSSVWATDVLDSSKLTLLINVVSLAGTPDASEAVKGKAEFSTHAELLAGTASMIFSPARYNILHREGTAIAIGGTGILAKPAEADWGLLYPLSGATAVNTLWQGDYVGQLVAFRATGTLSFTHDGTKMILANGGSSISMVAGDILWLEATSAAAARWRQVLPLMKADGTAVNPKLTRTTIPVTGAAVTTVPTANDSGKIFTFDCTGNSNFTPPAAAGCVGVYYMLANIAGQAITGKINVNPNGSETIDDELNRDLGQGDRVTIYCDGTKWITIAGTWSYISQWVAISFSSEQNYVNSLKKLPTNIQIFLKCNSAEGNYSVGDIVSLGRIGAASSNGFGVQVESGNIKVMTSAAVTIANKTTYAAFAIAAAKWDARIVAVCEITGGAGIT